MVRLTAAVQQGQPFNRTRERRRLGDWPAETRSGGGRARPPLGAGMNAEQAWQAKLGQLQMEMPRATFDTWVRDVDLLAYEDGGFVLGGQNAYARDWLENRLLSTVKRVLAGVMGRTVEVRFTVWQGETAEEDSSKVAEGEEASAERSAAHRLLNPRYTFDTFVVGPSNRLAPAAAPGGAEDPARPPHPPLV